MTVRASADFAIQEKSLGTVDRQLSPEGMKLNSGRVNGIGWSSLWRIAEIISRTT